MKTMNTVLSCFLGICVIVTGCTKEPLKNLSIEESRIYITDYDSAADFTSYKTYNVSDSATVIDNGVATKELTATDQAYIDAVNKYMQQRGYVQVTNLQNPDIGININRIYSTATGFIDNGYWNDYGGYYDPYYWGYSGYDYYVPYSYSVYQITEGAMSIDLLDLKNAAVKGTIDLLWTGLIRGEAIFAPENADAQVKTLFDQSPYLETTN